MYVVFKSSFQYCILGLHKTIERKKKKIKKKKKKKKNFFKKKKKKKKKKTFNKRKTNHPIIPK